MKRPELSMSMMESMINRRVLYNNIAKAIQKICMYC